MQTGSQGKNMLKVTFQINNKQLKWSRKIRHVV